MYCDGLPNDIYSDYILGTLAGPERAEVDAHLEGGCARCKLELASARDLWYNVALAQPTVKPSRALRQRVIASVREPRRFVWWQPVAALAALVLAVFAGTQINSKAPAPLVAVLPSAPPLITPSLGRVPAAAAPVPSRMVIVRPQDNSSLLAQVASAEQDVARQRVLLSAAERDRDELNRKYQAVLMQPKPDNSGIERQLTAAQLRTQQLEHDVAEYRTLLAKSSERVAPRQTASVFADPNLRLVRLRVTANGSEAEAHAFVASGSQVLFYASQLPALPPGRVYQLWLIRASAPAIVSAGIFQPDAQKRAMIQFNNAAFTSGITTIAVTEEPESGSATPTGHKLLIGT